jgi:hypothetical protein
LDQLRASSTDGGVFVPNLASPRSSASASGFRGSCTAFRGALWTVNQKTYDMMAAYANALNDDYGKYPVPDGGSVPGATKAQFNNAAKDSVTAKMILHNDWAQSGYAMDTVRISRSYGVTQPWNAGPFNWASWQVYMIQFEMDLAASGEMLLPNGGVAPFADAINRVNIAWQALKQLPCGS